MKSKKLMIMIILLVVSFNLHGAYTVVESNPQTNSHHEGSSTGGSTYLDLDLPATLLTIYRTDKNEVIDYTFSSSVTGIVRRELKKTHYQHWSRLRMNRKNSAVTPYFTAVTYTGRGTRNIERKDESNGVGIQYEAPTGDSTVHIYTKPRIKIQANTADSEFEAIEVVVLVSDINISLAWKGISLKTRVKLITIPNISITDGTIDFGKLETTSNTAKTAYGRIRITNNNNSNIFTISYPTAVNLTNAADNSKVPMNIDILNGSETGASVGNSLTLPAGTTTKELYVKATLPGSSIYNKSLGTYSGTVKVDVSVN